MNSESIAQYLRSKYEIYKKGSFVFMDGDKLSESRFPKSVDLKVFKGSEYSDIAFMDEEERDLFFRKTFRNLLKTAPTEGQIKYTAEIDSLKEIKEASELEDIPMDELISYWPLKDAITGDDLLFCSRSQKLANMDYTFWMTVVPKDLKDQIGVKACVAKYMPMDLRRSFQGHYSPTDDDVKMPVTYVNKHIAPAWRYKQDTRGVEGSGFITFMEHLVPDPKCRTYVLNWLRNAILKRNGTYLVLNGAKGIGKNIFTDLVKQLVGPRNFGKAPRSFLDSHFNSVLDNKRIILIDEQAINTPDKLDVLKDYINPFQNIERKGIDAREMVETFNSFIVSNNREVDLKIESDDRRFSVIDLTDKRLLDIWTEEQIDTFTKSFEDPDFLSMVGWYILDSCEADFGVEEAWKGPKFDRLVTTSLWEWQKFLLDTLLMRKKSSYQIETLKRKYNEVRSTRKSGLSVDLIRDFLQNYRHEGERLGTVCKVEKKWTIIPSEAFMPEDLTAPKTSAVEDLL